MKTRSCSYGGWLFVGSHVIKHGHGDYISIVIDAGAQFIRASLLTCQSTQMLNEGVAVRVPFQFDTIIDEITGICFPSMNGWK